MLDIIQVWATAGAIKQTATAVRFTVPVAVLCSPFYCPGKSPFTPSNTLCSLRNARVATELFPSCALSYWREGGGQYAEAFF